MKALEKRRAPVEKIMLEGQRSGWVAFSIGGCGILTQAIVGRHWREPMENRKLALAFSHRVVQTVGFAPSDDRVPTSQILVDAADAVIDDPEHVFLLCTIWQCLPEGVEICSVGSNSVLVFEEETVREAITPHTVNALLRRQGQATHPRQRGQVTHALGSRKNEKSCRMDDVRVALISLLPTTTIAVLEEGLLVDTLLEHPVAGNELASFIEAWNPPLGERISASVFISL